MSAFHERRLQRRLKDPEFRAAFNKAAEELAKLDTSPVPEDTPYAELEDQYLRDEAMTRAWVRHLVQRWGIDGGALANAIDRWLDEEPEPTTSATDPARSYAAAVAESIAHNQRPSACSPEPHPSELAKEGTT